MAENKIEKQTRKKKSEKDGRAKNGGAREGSGRKPFEPTPEELKQVEAMSGFGVPHEQIMTIIRDGICKETFYKYFQDVIDKGKAKANAKIGQSLYNKALSGDTTAMIWWTKSQMGWKGETVVLDHKSTDGSMTPKDVTGFQLLPLTRGE